MDQSRLSSYVSQQHGSNHDLSWLQSQFRNSPYSGLRGIVCELSNERLTVRGSVPSFYLKQVAQNLAMKTVAPELLESRIEVLNG